ncbi:MAG TPA: energy transducer TonB [Candidatus Kapabacteria bacterium]|jgi:TonB family protein|nr:energy transducer TonB [Candidatus Kapabacteria bacterium]
MNRIARCVILFAFLLFPLRAAVAQPSVPNAIEPWVDPDALAANLVYPRDAIRAGVAGRVVVRALIDTTGRVERAAVFESDDRMLDQAALDAVTTTRFSPGCQDGNPINLWVSIPIVFALDGSQADTTVPAHDADLDLATEPMLDEIELAKILRYPEVARSQGVEGTVVVRVLVDELGIARRYRIEKTANTILNQAALDAIFSTRFRPGTRDGSPVRSWVTVPVTFSLQ